MCVYVCVCVRFTRACVCVRVVRRTMPWHIIHVGGLVSLTVLFRGTSPMQARRSAAPAAAAKSDVDALILEAQMSEVDSMLAAVADAPEEMLEPALKLLIKMYTSIIDNPEEPKVRRIRWMNAKVQQDLAIVPIAQDFLLASGFCIIESPVEGSATGETEDVIIFKDGSSMTLLAEARGRLTRALALVSSGAGSRPVSSRLGRPLPFFCPQRMCSFVLKSPLTCDGEQHGPPCKHWRRETSISRCRGFPSLFSLAPGVAPPTRRRRGRAPHCNTFSC